MNGNNNAVTPKLKRCNAVHHSGTITKDKIDLLLSESHIEDEMAILIAEMEHEAMQDATQTDTQTTKLKNTLKK